MTNNPLALEHFSFFSSEMIIVFLVCIGIVIVLEEYKTIRKLFKQVYSSLSFMKKIGKKGFGDIGGVYQLVLVIGLIGVVGAIMLVVLSQLRDTTGIDGVAETAINNTITAVGSIPNTWLGIIVLIAILGVIVFLLIKSMGFFGGSRN